MAEETGQGEGGGTIRVRNIRADRQFSREMRVERLSVNTGEEKEASTDLLEEVRSVIDEQTETLGKTLREIKAISEKHLAESQGSNREFVRELRASITRGVRLAVAEAGGGGTGGGSGGGSSGGGGGGPDIGPLTDAITSGNKNLLDEIKNLREAFQSLAVRESVPGGEDSGAGVSGRGFGDVRALEKLYESASGVADRFIAGSRGFEWLEEQLASFNTQITDLVSSGIIQELHANIGNLAQRIQTFGRELVDFQNVTSFFSDRFNKGLEASASGIEHFGSFIIPGFMRSGDQLAATLDTVKSTLDSDLISPIGSMGMDLEEVSRTLESARWNMRGQGVDGLSRIGWQEANEAMIGLFDLERRRDVTANLRDSITQQRIAKEFEYYQLIATNTGKTVDELIKSNRQTDLTITQLVSSGILDERSAAGFLDATAALRGKGMNGMADLLEQVANSGGSLPLFLSENPEMRDSLAATGHIGELQTILDIIRSGNLDANSTNQLMGLAKRFQNNPSFGPAGSQFISKDFQKLSGEAGLAGDFKENRDPIYGEATIRAVTDFLDNNLPRAEVGMVAALIANTLALWRNTAALGGSGLISGLLGGGKNFLGKAGGWMKGIGGRALGMGAGALSLGGAGLGMAGSIGKSVAGAGGSALKGLGKIGIGSLLKKIPGIGLLAGLGYGGYRAMSGDWSGAGMELASGAASLVPGLGTAASVGIDGALAARDMGAFGDSKTPTVGPAQGTATTNQGLRTDTQRLLLENNRLLAKMLDTMGEQTDLQEEIKRNTGKVPGPAKGWFDDWFGNDDVQQTG